MLWCNIYVTVAYLVGEEEPMQLPRGDLEGSSCVGSVALVLGKLGDNVGFFGGGAHGL